MAVVDAEEATLHGHHSLPSIDDLPEMIDDPESPRAYERPIKLTPAQSEQVRRMMKKAPPDWLAAVIERQSR